MCAERTRDLAEQPRAAAPFRGALCQGLPRQPHAAGHPALRSAALRRCERGLSRHDRLHARGVDRPHAAGACASAWTIEPARAAHRRRAAQTCEAQISHAQPANCARRSSRCSASSSSGEPHLLLMVQDVSERQRPRGAAPAGAEDGSDRPTGGRHRARFQQPAHHHPGPLQPAAPQPGHATRSPSLRHIEARRRAAPRISPGSSSPSAASRSCSRSVLDLNALIAHMATDAAPPDRRAHRRA